LYSAAAAIVGGGSATQGLLFAISTFHTPAPAFAILLTCVSRHLEPCLLSVSQRLRAVVANYGKLLIASRNLDFFTSFYRFLIQLLPAAVVAPLFFAGEACQQLPFKQLPLVEPATGG
jgi:hypothetical protein